MAKCKYENNVKDKLILVEGWARNGLTDEQIAKNLGISKTTFYKYIKEHNELSECLKKGKEVIDFEVENALLKRALGYKYKEVTKELFKNPKTNKEELKVTKEVIKEVAPDTTAQIFWLKNRKPQEWRDKQNIEHSGNMNISNPFKELTTEELKRIAQLGDNNG
ncbi:helix-turn-helix domain-containing protein [Clostridium niameyense]|uniref:Helix-turn-helix domain-containing protein n=1 Tax=Clostridium niameyense TaxID=1622073 RepID=A0A6M0RA08_9CLOT|nr:helix-turn-helix domain-containing protein [Clostridium niameyense]NEZ46510.1 helix-turn-helix domain-containing protein [Clostridium niameyense]